VADYLGTQTTNSGMGVALPYRNHEYVSVAHHRESLSAPALRISQSVI
jgi:hypothetical protein